MSGETLLKASSRKISTKRVFAVTHIYENIKNKRTAFTKDKESKLQKILIEFKKTGINEDKNKNLARITYIQNSTGASDFIILLEAESIEDLLQAVNIIRSKPQVLETHTHVGEKI